MFTGIIEEIGTVRAVRAGRTGAVLDIEASKVLEGTAVGDSIAVNGVCLTVTPGQGHFTADAMPETLRRTSLGSLSAGSKVNLERAMLCGGRFGGHIVSGHVDACGRVAALEKDGIALLMRVSVPEQVLRYIAEKGSVTLDGTSLTVASVWADSFTVSLILILWLRLPCICFGSVRRSMWRWTCWPGTSSGSCISMSGRMTAGTKES